MALSTCRDCNREVSTLAHHCVHCGRPRPTGTSSCSVIAGIVTVVVALALTGAVVFAARKACKKLSDRASMECRSIERILDCSDKFVRYRAADGSVYIRSLEQDGTRLIEVKPGLYKLQPAPDGPKEEQK